MENKPVIMFTVSGAPGGDKLNAWIASSGLPKALLSKMKHVALLGRQIPAELTWFDWIMLKIAGLKNKDPKAAKEEYYGFDYMDKSTIEPIVELVKEFESSEMVS